MGDACDVLFCVPHATQQPASQPSLPRLDGYECLCWWESSVALNKLWENLSLIYIFIQMFIRTNCEATFFGFFPVSLFFRFCLFGFAFLNIFILMFWFRVKENKQNYLNRLFVWVFFRKLLPHVSRLGGQEEKTPHCIQNLIKITSAPIRNTCKLKRIMTPSFPHGFVPTLPNSFAQQTDLKREIFLQSYMHGTGIIESI